MAKKQNFIVGSTNPNTNTWTTAELNNGWNKYQVLKSGDLDGVFNAVSDYSNDSSNEIANAIQALTGEQPTGASQSELGSALQKMREEIETSSLTFKGYVSTSAPSSSTYSLVEGNIWINASAMPTTFPVAIAGVWNGTSWATTTDTYTVKDFDFFRNINNNEGYYWFGGQWTVMSTDMSTTYFTLNQTSGKWEIKSSVNLPGSPTTTTAPAGTSSTRIATTAFVANNFAKLASPAFTGTPTAPTATAGTANTQIATTAFVATSVAGFAPLASPAFTGTPTTTTPTSSSPDNQIATKKYVDEAIAPLPTNTYFPDLFDVKWADHICDDVQWLCADTFSWQSGAVYQAAYQHLSADITGKTLQSETISGTTIQFYLADDGHKICPASEESNVVSIYNATGVAWYYIIDTVNERFKLPRIDASKAKIINSASVSLQGTGTAIHIHTTSGGNANKDARMQFSNNETLVLAAYDGWHDQTGTDTVYFGDLSGNNVGLTGTADLAGATSYFAGAKYLYFYVGNFTQTALENTAGVTTEVLNRKADLDLSNITTSAMSTLFSAISPDYSQGTTLSQNTNYTATEDCWLYVSVNSSAQAAGADVNKTLTIGGQDFRICSWAYDKNVLFMPCPKGTAFKLTNNNTGQGSYEFKKYPCKGV